MLCGQRPTHIPHVCKSIWFGAAFYVCECQRIQWAHNAFEEKKVHISFISIHFMKNMRNSKQACNNNRCWFGPRMVPRRNLTYVCISKFIELGGPNVSRTRHINQSLCPIFRSLNSPVIDDENHPKSSGTFGVQIREIYLAACCRCTHRI